MAALRFALFGINTSSRIVYLNSIWPTLTGITIEDCLGQDITTLFPDQANVELLREFSHALAVSRVIRGELTLLTPHAHRVWLEVNAHTKVDSQQRIVGITGRFTDITARKQWQQRNDES
jgi:PAS domain S-box-containing protein